MPQATAKDLNAIANAYPSDPRLVRNLHIHQLQQLRWQLYRDPPTTLGLQISSREWSFMLKEWDA